MRDWSAGHRWLWRLLYVALMNTSCGVVEEWFRLNHQSPECASSADCSAWARSNGDPNPELWMCHAPSARCVPQFRSCNSKNWKDVCCPSESCTPLGSDNGVCVATGWDRCELTWTAPCRVKGQVCQTEIGPFYDMTVCAFLPCTNGACSGNTACFNGYCVGETPCDGRCEAAEVCLTISDVCVPLGSAPDQSCLQTCRPGTMRVYRNSTDLLGLCSPENRSCECEPLPAIPSSGQ